MIDTARNDRLVRRIVDSTRELRFQADQRAKKREVEQIAGPTVEPRMPDGSPAPYVMTPEQLLRFLGLPDSKVPAIRRFERMRQRGLKSKQVANRTRFLLTDVLQWLNSSGGVQ